MGDDESKIVEKVIVDSIDFFRNLMITVGLALAAAWAVLLILGLVLKDSCLVDISIGIAAANLGAQVCMSLIWRKYRDRLVATLENIVDDDDEE